jgi:hypothetical protein
MSGNGMVFHRRRCRFVVFTWVELAGVTTTATAGIERCHSPQAGPMSSARYPHPMVVVLDRSAAAQYAVADQLAAIQHAPLLDYGELHCSTTYLAPEAEMHVTGPR